MTSFIIMTGEGDYPVEATYDAQAGVWALHVDVPNGDGDIAVGSGGSLELAAYSCSEAIRAYEAHEGIG